MTPRVALVGAGRWGKNLLRVLAESPACELVAVVDTSAEARAAAHAIAPRATACADLDEALARPLDAVVVATPPASHAALALQALAARKSVLVEKPLATTVADAARCARGASARGRPGVVGMVGHLLRYHPTAAELARLALAGELGELRAVYAARLSTGGAPSEAASSLLFRLAPHDLSLLDALDASPLVAATVRATPGASGAAGPLVLTARTRRGLPLHLTLSRNHTEKVRRFAIVGTRRVALFDDVAAPTEVLTMDAAKLGHRSPLELRANELEATPVPWLEPLAAEVAHFLDCVVRGARPRTPFEEGVRVARSLAHLDAALRVHATTAPNASGYGEGAATAAPSP